MFAGVQAWANFSTAGPQRILKSDREATADGRSVLQTPLSYEGKIIHRIRRNAALFPIEKDKVFQQSVFSATTFLFQRRGFPFIP